MTSSSDEPAAGGPPTLELGNLAEPLLSGLAEFSPAGIGIISVLENRYVHANPALCELYGMSREEVLRTDPFTMALRITHPDELVAEQKLFGELAVGARRSYRIEKRIQRRDGSPRWGLATLIGLFAPSPDPSVPQLLSWVIVNIIDITEAKALREALRHREEELRHAQKVDALGRLAAGIAHDFNNLLTVITGHAEVLKDVLAQPAGARDGSEDLNAIVAAADRAAALTAQLLTHGRRERAAPQAFLLSELTAMLQRLLQRTLGSNVEVESVMGAKGAVFADQGQVGQVVMNLMLNARDALDEGGRIRLETRDVVGGAPGSVPGPGAWVALIVADNGHGMTPEVQARMFEPFFTTRAERPGMQGNGLGLATVQRIVSEARGQIEVRSAPGHGTTLTVYFPRSEEALALMPSIPPVPPRAAPNQRRILVIEDDPSVRSLVGMLLLGAHYRVSVAPDGAEGLRLLDAADDPVHLIVTDLVMPRIGGASLAQRLKEREPRPRVLFISGYNTHTPAELASLGSFLPKPFTPAQLLAAVAQALEEPG